MKHCGKAHVCYFCLERSFPWENGFAQSHWELCPRWDHDSPWYPCRDGECHWEGKECQEETHAPFVKRMHELRWQAAVNFLQKDNIFVFAFKAMKE